MKNFQRIIPDHIPEEEVPNIIQRASELQSQVVYRNTKHTHREIQDIAEELEIEEQYIKQALEELYNKTEPTETTKKITNKEMKFSNKNLLIIIIILLICLLAAFLPKDNTSEIVLSGNNSTLIMPRENSTVEQPKSISEDEINTQKQFLLQQIELLKNQNRLLEEQKRALTEKKNNPKSSEEQRDRTLDQERVKLQKQAQELEQQKIEQQRALLEEQKKS